MEVKTEPAGRLHDIFHAAREQPEDNSARKVWATIFDVPEGDTGAILKMLADLIQLTNETKEKIGRLNDIDHQIYLRPFSRIERILSQINLDASWKHWRDQIDEPTIYGLKFCSDKLYRATNYTEISNDELAKIKNALSELTDTVLESELHASLKQLLIRNLERLRQALIAYRIRGIDGIEQEMELNLGSIVRHRDDIRENSGPGKDGKIWKIYLGFLDGLNKTLSTAKNIKELGGGEITKLLGVGHE